jgi:hypothetical protein
MPYVLARVQLRYGNQSLETFNESLAILSKLMIDQGLVLLNAMTTHSGRLYEIWNLWRVEDSDHMARVRARLRQVPAYHEAHAKLSTVILEEEIRYLSDMPYAPK